MLLRITGLDKNIEIVAECKVKAFAIGKKVVKYLECFEGSDDIEMGFYTSKHLICAIRLKEKFLLIKE